MPYLCLGVFCSHRLGALPWLLRVSWLEEVLSPSTANDDDEKRERQSDARYGESVAAAAITYCSRRVAQAPHARQNLESEVQHTHT